MHLSLPIQLRGQGSVGAVLACRTVTDNDAIEWIYFVLYCSGLTYRRTENYFTNRMFTNARM
jgi:hypothetical protein